MRLSYGYRKVPSLVLNLNKSQQTGESHCNLHTYQKLLIDRILHQYQHFHNRPTLPLICQASKRKPKASLTFRLTYILFVITYMTDPKASRRNNTGAGIEAWEVKSSVGEACAVEIFAIEICEPKSWSNRSSEWPDLDALWLNKANIWNQSLWYNS